MTRFRTLYSQFDGWMSGDAAGKKKIEAEWAANGYKWGGFKKGYGALRALKGGDRTKLPASCKDAGLGLDSWQHACGMGLACFGQSFATPVSDGEAVYVATAFDSFWKISLMAKSCGPHSTKPAAVSIVEPGVHP